MEAAVAAVKIGFLVSRGIYVSYTPNITNKRGDGRDVKTDTNWRERAKRNAR